jgi:hypothetical protein
MWFSFKERGHASEKIYGRATHKNLAFYVD